MTKNKKLLSAIISLTLLFTQLVLPLGVQAAQGSYQTVGLFNGTNEIDTFDNVIFFGGDYEPVFVTGIGGKPVNDTSIKLIGQKDDISAVSIINSSKNAIAKAVTFEFLPSSKLDHLRLYGRGQDGSGKNIYMWNAMQIPGSKFIPNVWNRVMVMLDTQGKARVYANNELVFDWDKSYTNSSSFKWNYLRISSYYTEDATDEDMVMYLDELQVLNAQPTLPELTSNKYEINGTEITNIGSTVGDVLDNVTYYGEKIIIKDSAGNDITSETTARMMEDYQLLVKCGDVITGHYYFGPVEKPSDYFTPQVEVTLLSEKVADDKKAQLEATVNAYNNEVLKVDFFKDGVLVFTDTEAPYIYEEIFEEGTYEITAAVTDVYKETGESSSVTITSVCGTSPKLDVSLIDSTEYQKEELSAVKVNVKFEGAQLKDGYVMVDGEKFADLALGENSVDLSAVTAGEHTIKFYVENDLGESTEQTFKIKAMMLFEKEVVSEKYETDGSAGGTDNGLGFIRYETVNSSYGKSVVVGAEKSVDTGKEGAWIALDCGNCSTRVVMNFDFYVSELDKKIIFMSIPSSGYQRPKFLEIESGKFKSENGNTYAFEDNRWYNITVDMNVAKKTFNLVVDGEVVMRDEKTNLPDGLSLSNVRVISQLQGADKTRYYALDNYTATHVSSSPIITNIVSPNAYDSYQVYSGDTTVKVTFSDSITEASIYPSKFTITSGAESAKIKKAVYDSSDYSITFELEEPLKAGKTYRFKCADNIVMGNGMLYGESIYADFEVVKIPLTADAVEITTGGTFKAEVTNESTDAKTAYVIMNVFEDGKLIDSYTEAVTLNSGVNTLEKPIPAYSADRTVNVFMWDLLAKPYRFAQISE